MQLTNRKTMIAKPKVEGIFKCTPQKLSALNATKMFMKNRISLFGLMVFLFLMSSGCSETSEPAPKVQFLQKTGMPVPPMLGVIPKSLDQPTFWTIIKRRIAIRAS